MSKLKLMGSMPVGPMSVIGVSGVPVGWTNRADVLFSPSEGFVFRFDGLQGGFEASQGPLLSWLQIKGNQKLGVIIQNSIAKMVVEEKKSATVLSVYWEHSFKKDVQYELEPLRWLHFCECAIEFINENSKE